MSILSTKRQKIGFWVWMELARLRRGLQRLDKAIDSLEEQVIKRYDLPSY